MARLLIIEDDKLIRWSLREILSKEGYIVDTAKEVGTAVKSAQENQYEVIFIDLETDDSNPVDTIKRLRQLQPDSALIVLSAMNNQDINQITQGESIFEVIDKPFQADTVRRVVKESLEGKNTQGKKE